MWEALEYLLPWLIAVGFALLVGYGFARLRAGDSASSESDEAEVSLETTPAADLFEVARKLSPVLDSAARPSDLLEHPAFRAGLQTLDQQSLSVDALIGYYRGESPALACLALEALTAMPTPSPDIRVPILESINDYGAWTRYFAIRVLEAHTPQGEAVGRRLLGRLDDSWAWPANLRVLEEFLRRRLDSGESLGIDLNSEPRTAEEVEEIAEVIGKLPEDLRTPLRESLEDWRGQRVDLELLESIGRVWKEEPKDGHQGTQILEHEALLAATAAVQAALKKEPRSSSLLVGDHGVGKTTVVQTVAARLRSDGWLVFEAGQADLLAGQSYFGQLEERMRKLIEALKGRRILWFIPDFHTLALAGRHRYGPASVLDVLLPFVESGQVVVIGETSSASYDPLVQSKPALLTAMETQRLHPLGETATRDLIAQWADSRARGETGLSVETRDEALLLAQQYLGDRAAPGNVLKLLEMTRQRQANAGGEDEVRIESSELIETLTQLTGLPAAILDDRQGLDLPSLRQAFETRVMGQPDATDCLVERVAMIKAGVTDPTRPLGVFLFAGPTGTGKTEIAKALASFLFGAEARLVRLDMSEFQTPDSLERIFGGTDKDSRGGALIDRVRKQPFSVILLDEFEKAHANVWDVFLQLFDDGRLTDPNGNTADFRNTIVILTSNLGSTIPTGASLGFQDASGQFSETKVLRSVEQSFRKEFLNRLDQVIVFRPLSRETMRGILRKELTEAFSRRGLRNRAWAVEWDESAIEFLLQAGFTQDLGARPLRRAIERHLLAPLAMTIVNHQYPDGDQFLLVRAEGGSLVVEFVDPDAPDDAEEPETESSPIAGNLAAIALEPKGVMDETRYLSEVCGDLIEDIECEPWASAKSRAFQRMRERDFWDSNDRFATLGYVEYVDRVEAGVQSARGLIERLAGGRKVRDRYPRQLLGRIARQLFVLREAYRGVVEGEPREAFLRVDAWSDSGKPSRRANEFASRIGAMHIKWAEKRAMPYVVLSEERGAADEPYRLLLSITGYAAYSLLAAERGLHVVESPSRRGPGWRRAAVRVRVAPHPDTPPVANLPLETLARELFDGLDEPIEVARRYRENPSPLVRDAAQGWRSGKLDRVLDGDFDLIARIRQAPTDDSM